MAKLPRIGIPQWTRPTVNTALHAGARFLFERAGFRWETRRAGEMRIGLWRIPLNKKKRTVNTKRLVLLPGFGDTPLSWLPVMLLLRPMLPRFYDEMILVDFPGFHGFLSRERMVPNMDSLFESTGDLLDSLKPHTLVGHSLGGWLAGNYAGECGATMRPRTKTRYFRSPETVILISPSGIFGGAKEKEVWQAKFAEAVEHGFERFRKRLFAREPFWFKWTAKEFGYFFDREDTQSFMKSVRDDHDLESKLEKIRGKIWIIWGEEDGLSPSQWTRHWLNSLTGADAHGILIKNAGHSVQLERPAAVAATLAYSIAGKIPHPAGRRWWTLVEAAN